MRRDRGLRTEAEDFVRMALAESSGKGPSKRTVEKVAAKIVSQFKSVVRDSSNLPAAVKAVR